MAQPWPGKANAVAGNFYQLPDGKVRFYAGGDEFRVYGVDNQGNERIALDGLISQLGQSLSGLMPKEGRRRHYGSGMAMHDFGGLPSRSVAPRIATGADADSRPEQGADLDMAAIEALSKKYGADPALSNEQDVGDSEYRRMAQQYGDAEMRNAMLNQAGEGTSLADYYGAQRQLGGMVSADEEQGKAMEDYFMTLPGFDTREKAQAFIGQNPGIAFKEFNKANPMAMVGDKPAMIEEEAITDFMDTGLDRDEAIRRIRGGMTPQTESNLEQTAQGQPVAAQVVKNHQEYTPLNGLNLLSEMARNVYGQGGKRAKLTPTQLRNDPFLQD